MNKADQEELNTLHGELAKVLTTAIKEGVKMMDKDGEIVSTTASPSLLSVARQFLKDNNIEADVKKNAPLHGLASVLPFAGAQ